MILSETLLVSWLTPNLNNFIPFVFLSFWWRIAHCRGRGCIVFPQNWSFITPTNHQKTIRSSMAKTNESHPKVLDHNEFSIFQEYFTLLENACKSKCLKLSNSNVVATLQQIQTLLRKHGCYDTSNCNTCKMLPCMTHCLKSPSSFLGHTGCPNKFGILTL